MTIKEKELLTLIRENENPEQALITAVLIIGTVLEKNAQHQQLTVQEQPVDFQRGLA